MQHREGFSEYTDVTKFISNLADQSPARIQIEAWNIVVEESKEAGVPLPEGAEDERILAFAISKFIRECVAKPPGNSLIHLGRWSDSDQRLLPLCDRRRITWHVAVDPGDITCKTCKHLLHESMAWLQDLSKNSSL